MISEAVWSGPIVEFVRFAWRSGHSSDFRPEKSDDTLLQEIKDSFKVLVPIDNQGRSRGSLFSTNGEPEFSRVRLINAIKILRFRGRDSEVRAVLEVVFGKSCV